MADTYGINGETIYHDITGEVIDIQEIIKIKEENAILEFNQTINEIYDLGGNSDLKIIKYKNREYCCVEVKREYEFNKEFRVELRDIMLSKNLGKNSKIIMATLSPFVSFPSNAVIIKGKNPTYIELMDILDLSKPVLMSALNELEDNEIIKRHKINGQTIIYFNCFLYIGGKCVEKDTFELFKNSRYNPLIDKI